MFSIAAYSGRVLLVLAASTSAVAASAQEQPRAPQGDEQVADRANGGPGGDIIVTAQRREERLIDVPQSVTVLSGDDLARLGATQFRDFANTVPGLVFQSSGPGQTQISLRGVTAGFDVSGTVGIYVDEVPYGTTTTFARGGRYTPDGNVNDIARVEVLRGPQGTLYGASSMGGVLKYVSKLPDARSLSGEAHAGVSDTRYGGTSYNAAAGINLPIATDRLALRVSGFYTRDGGYIDNPRRNARDVNRAEIYGGRVDLLFTPTDELSVRIAGELQHIDRQGAGDVDFTPDVRYSFPINGDLTQNRQFSEPFKSEFRVVSGTIKYDFGPVALTSVTSYQETRVDNSYDYTAAGIFGPGLTFLTDQPRTDKFTQELRLGGTLGSLITFTAGGFYTSEKSDRNSEVVYTNPATGAVVPNLFVVETPSKYDEYAGFANLTVNLTDKFDVTGGVRVAHNQQSYTQIGQGYASTLPTARSSETVATYLANARYQFSHNLTAYARFATGYRPGGPNFISTVVATPPTFGADRLNSYEAGFKGQTSDRTFGIDVALYHIDWKDIQTFDLSSPFGGYINGPRAKIDGGEAALSARPAKGLTFSGTFAVQNARLAENDTNLGAKKGDSLPNVPRYQAAVSGDYELPLSSVHPTVGATVRFVSDRTQAFSANPAFREVPDYTQVDLRAGAKLSVFDIQAFVRNVFDTRGQLSVFNASGLPPRVAITQPRTIGLNTSVRF